MVGAAEKDCPKRPSDRQLPEALKKTDRAITLVAEAVRVPERLVPTEYLQVKQLCHLHAQLSLGQSCHRLNKFCIYAHRVASVVSDCLRSCRLWPARILSGRGFSRQEYWNVLASTGCHSLLEHDISCCPSCQLPWLPSAARTSATKAAAPPPHLALTGATQVLQGSLRSKPQWMTHMQRWK